LRVLESFQVNSLNHVAEALALGEFVKRRVRYVKDIFEVEQIHDPIHILQELSKGQAQGDCDDMVLFLATLLLSVGIQPHYRIVRYKANTGPYNHIYIVVYETTPDRPGPVRVVLDTILKYHPIGTEVPHVSGKEIPA
jgi:hypothetical protein